MKKLVIFILVAFLAGCQNKPEPNIVKIELESNVTTGYTWNYKIDDQSIIRVSKEEYIPDNIDGMVGVPGKHEYKIQGLKEGNTTLTFIYQRSWEEEAIETKIYNCNVDKNIQITCK